MMSKWTKLRAVILLGCLSPVVFADMNKNFTIISRLWSLNVILLMCCAAHGSGGFSELNLSISTESTICLPMEPIPITIALTNNTDRLLIGHSVIAPNSGFLDIYIKSGNEDYKLFRSADWPMAMVIPSEMPFEPWDEKTSFGKEVVKGYLYSGMPSGSVHDDPNDVIELYLLPRPGQYKFKVRLKNIDRKEEIESNIITIDVLEPSGVDLTAYNIMKESKLPYFLMKHNSSKRKTSLKFLSSQEKFLNDYPKSHYARYLEHTLGLSYVMDGKGSGDLQLKNFGIALLGKSANYEYFLAEGTLEKLVGIAIKDNKASKAQEYAQKMEERFPNSDSTRIVQRKIKRWLKDAEAQKAKDKIFEQ